MILLRREDLKCTFCGSGITTEMLHYLFDCAALSEERRKLNDKTGQLCPSFPALINEISKNRTPTEDEDDLRYDRPYGWVVAIASFYCNLVVEGTAFSFGLFLESFNREFGLTKSTTSWVGSSLAGTYLLMGRFPLLLCALMFWDVRASFVYGLLSKNSCHVLG
ncbi:hypothetical protein LAZ67_8003702 [Cordylochernes scorpioides]|uniref:Uncharacterized protein n=1 Tax=Cordylochernes scorpioides TaxID=51811 RepID=A0ABY6KWV2_9ARAC|nr:hypothetical protein LAZ67_8003702 [Cordylochernes scorpioides]